MWHHVHARTLQDRPLSGSGGCGLPQRQSLGVHRSKASDSLPPQSEGGGECSSRVTQTLLVTVPSPGFLSVASACKRALCPSKKYGLAVLANDFLYLVACHFLGHPPGSRLQIPSPLKEKTMQKKSCLMAAVAALGLAAASWVQAAPIQVGVMNGGGFGGVNGTPNTAQQGLQNSTLGFVNSGFQVQTGDVVQVLATGLLCLSSGTACTNANGLVMPGTGFGTAHYTGLNNLFGALVGSIVGDDSGNFQAYDAADVSKGIAQSSLFALGSNMQFTANNSGRLYLGVTDSAFWDNTGPGFQVSLSLIPSNNNVPAPSAWALAGLALLGAFAARRRSD